MVSDKMSQLTTRKLERETVVLRWNRLANLADYGKVMSRGSTVTLLCDAVYLATGHGKLTALSCKSWSWNNLGYCLFGLGNWHIAQLAEEKIYFYGGNGFRGLVEYDTVLGESREVATFGEAPVGRQYMTSVFAEWRNEIITFGGFKRRNQNRSNDTHALNVKSKSWKKLELKGKPPEPRTVHAATIVGTTMYIYGGYKDFAVLQGDLWMAELSRRDALSWSQPQINGRIPAPRILATVNNLNEAIVLFGGYGVRGTMQDVHIFSRKAQEWSYEQSPETLVKGTPPTNSDRHHGLTTSVGVLYLTHSGVFLLSQER